jgi:hypothetical protein
VPSCAGLGPGYGARPGRGSPGPAVARGVRLTSSRHGSRGPPGAARGRVLARILSFDVLRGGRSGQVFSASNKRQAQNWHGPGESDCLIKTKHRAAPRRAQTRCDFCPVL